MRQRRGQGAEGVEKRGAEVDSGSTPIDRRGGRDWGLGIPLPSRLGGLGERRKLPSGVRGEPRPKTGFGAF